MDKVEDFQPENERIFNQIGKELIKANIERLSLKLRTTGSTEYTAGCG